jgi:hypothetical protein
VNSSNEGVGGRELGVGKQKPTPDSRFPIPEVRKLTLALLALLALVFAFSRLDLLYSGKFFDVTGRAEWIWAQHRLSLNVPVAFFATRNFDLPPNRQFTRIKVFGDPEYILYFNGALVGGRRVGEESTVDVYDVSKLARDRGNRIVIGARSPNGVGGVIASIDVSGEFQNMFPTGSEWAIVRSWRDDLLVRDPPATDMSSPMRLGRPPIGRWNYLSRRDGTFMPAPQRIVQARSAVRFKTAIPTIEDRSGVLVVVPRPVSARAYDFGAIAGRARFTIDYDNGVSRSIDVRFANAPSELRSIEGPVEPFVFAAGERTIIDPQERRFRYVMVYGSEASVTVAQ